MSIECGECERDARGGHLDSCSRHPLNKRIAALTALLAEAQAVVRPLRDNADPMLLTQIVAADAFLAKLEKAT